VEERQPESDKEPISIGALASREDQRRGRSDGQRRKRQYALLSQQDHSEKTLLA
jgi:hypothetical protein